MKLVPAYTVGTLSTNSFDDKNIKKREQSNIIIEGGFTCSWKDCPQL